MKRLVLAVAVAMMLFGAMGAGAQAAKRSSASCTVTPNQVAVGQTYTVSASGLPSGSPIYLWITDAHNATITSTYLGTTSTGSFTLSESSSSAGIWSYQFTGPTKASNTPIYATCSLTVG